jgi:hypothetical protein
MDGEAHKRMITLLKIQVSRIVAIHLRFRSFPAKRTTIVSLHQPNLSGLNLSKTILKWSLISESQMARNQANLVYEASSVSKIHSSLHHLYPWPGMNNLKIRRWESSNQLRTDVLARTKMPLPRTSERNLPLCLLRNQCQIRLTKNRK